MNDKLFFALFFVLVAFGAHAGSTTINQSHKSFDAEELAVAAGDTVTFKNSDDVTHNVQVIDKEGLTDDRGMQKPGQDIKYTFTRSGEYKIRCSLHPKMKLTITVK